VTGLGKSKGAVAGCRLLRHKKDPAEKDEEGEGEAKWEGRGVGVPVERGT